MGCRIFIVGLALSMAAGCGSSEEQVAATEAQAAEALPSSVVDSVSVDSITSENAEEMLKKLEAEINSADSY